MSNKEWLFGIYGMFLFVDRNQNDAAFLNDNYRKGIKQGQDGYPVKSDVVFWNVASGTDEQFKAI